MSSMMALDFEIPRWVVEVGFAAYAVSTTGFVVLERRRPTTTLALVLALVFLPVLGLIVYVLFSRRVQRRIRQRERRPISPVEGTRNVANLESLPDDLPEPARGLVHLALKSAAAPLRRADACRLLPTAPVAFSAFEEGIGCAQRTIHCEFYIWRDDATGRRITQMLVERARAGVKVRVLYDHIGSLGLPRAHFEALREAGGEIGVFGHLRLPLSRLRVNFRNHRKIMTIDGERGYLGGLNIGDEYLDPQGDDRRWRDLHVELRGDAVIGLEAIFMEDWLASTGHVLDMGGERLVTSGRFDARRPLPRERPWRRRNARTARAQALRANPFAPMPDTPMESEGPLVQVIPSGPDRPLVSVIAAQFSAAIATATRRVWMATPYFIPDEPLMLILRIAALRGVDLRILVPDPAHNDQRLTALASRTYYEEVLSAGGKLFEYQRGMLHAKYLIVDDLCAIGSANMDVRSFHINYEVTAMFYDARVTAALAELFEHDLSGAEAVIDDGQQAPLWTRLGESTARLLSPLL